VITSRTSIGGQAWRLRTNRVIQRPASLFKATDLLATCQYYLQSDQRVAGFGSTRARYKVRLYLRRILARQSGCAQPATTFHKSASQRFLVGQQLEHSAIWRPMASMLMARLSRSVRQRSVTRSKTSAALREQADAQATTFDRAVWQANYIHWIVLGTQSLASWLLTTLRRPLVVQHASGPSR
jgi:hypothetical protein